jgi:hypothetical protein
LLSYRASIPLSNHTLTRLADLIRAERRSRWRRLDPARQALLVLAHLRNGDTYARLAAGFAIGTTTAWRYIREAVDLLATLADDVHTAVKRASRLAYTILDGTLIPIDRLADDRPYYSGKHKQHGMNVQLLADPAGRLVVARAAGRQPRPQPHPRHRGACRRDLEVLEGADQTALLPASSDPARAGNPRAAAGRRGPLLRLKGLSSAAT